MKLEAEIKYKKGQQVCLIKRPDLGTFTISTIAVYPTETSSKVAYTLRQRLFESGSLGFEEYFTLKGIHESEIQPVQVDEVFNDGESINLFNYD